MAPSVNRLAARVNVHGGKVEGFLRERDNLLEMRSFRPDMNAGIGSGEYLLLT